MRVPIQVPPRLGMASHGTNPAPLPFGPVCTLQRTQRHSRLVEPRLESRTRSLMAIRYYNASATVVSSRARAPDLSIYLPAAAALPFARPRGAWTCGNYRRAAVRAMGAAPSSSSPPPQTPPGQAQGACRAVLLCLVFLALLLVNNPSLARFYRCSLERLGLFPGTCNES